MSETDRDYLVAVAAERAGISPEVAETRINEVLTQAEQFAEKARETAEQARRTVMIAAFLAAASLVVSAAAAYFGGTLDSNHRDKQVVVEGWHRPWLLKAVTTHEAARRSTGRLFIGCQEHIPSDLANRKYRAASIGFEPP